MQGRRVLNVDSLCGLPAGSHGAESIFSTGNPCRELNNPSVISGNDYRYINCLSIIIRAQSGLHSLKTRPKISFKCQH